MENINAERDYQSNDFQRSVNYDNESSRTQLNSTQLNSIQLADTTIPYTLLVDTSLAELAITFGCTIETLKELNPDYKDYTEEQKIPKGTILELPDNTALKNTVDHDNVNTTVPSVTNEINEDLKKELADRPVEVEEEGGWWDWITEVIVAVLIQVGEAALEASGLDIVIAVVKTIDAVLAGDWETAAKEAAILAEKVILKAIPLAGKLRDIVDKVNTVVDLTDAASKGDWEKVGGIVAQEAISKAAEKAVGKIQEQVGTWKGEMQQGIIPVIPPQKKQENLPTILVDDRLSKLRIPTPNDKIEIEQNKLPIPERELIENNNKVTPIQTPKTTNDKPKNDKSKDDEDSKKEASNSERLAAIDKDKHYLSEADKTLFDQVVNDEYSLANKEQLEQRDANIAQLEAATAKRKNQLSSIEEELKKALPVPEPKIMEMLTTIKNNKLEEDLLPLLKAKNFNNRSTIPFLTDLDRNPNSIDAKRAKLKILREELNNNSEASISLTESKADKPKPNIPTTNLKPEFLEAENFIKPYIKGNSPANQEQRRTLLLNLQNTGTAGQKMLAHIKSGKFDKIEGYDELILSASKKPDANDNGYSHELVAANQALDAADKYLKTYPTERIRFEHKGGSDFDIDLGIKNANNPQVYDEAMQCKAWRGKISKNKIEAASGVLKNTPSHQNTKRIVDIICDSETTFADIQQNLEHFEFYGDRNSISEFRILLSNNQKYIVKNNQIIPD